MNDWCSGGEAKVFAARLKSYITWKGDQPMAYAKGWSYRVGL